MAKAKAVDHDKLTLDLIEKVKTKRAEIAKIEKPNYKTNCSFSFSEGGGNSTNLHVESNIGKLISIAAHLTNQKNAYQSAAEVLEIESPPDFKWGGYLYQDWIDDLKLRVKKVQISKRKEELETFESRLNAIISPELKRQMELEELSKSI